MIDYITDAITQQPSTLSADWHGQQNSTTLTTTCFQNQTRKHLAIKLSSVTVCIRPILTINHLRIAI